MSADLFESKIFPERSTSIAIEPGLRILVTAGGRGIGRAIVERFGAHDARVHACDIAVAALDDLRQSCPAVTVSVTDVGDDNAVAALFADVQRQLGGLDVLVNNAGIRGPAAPVEDISPEDWRRTIDVNLNGQFYCTRLAVPMLRASPRGAIVNISSVAGRMGYALRTPYAASKWGVIGFTESLAKELGEAGIRVNAILPGNVEGERLDRAIAERAAALRKPADEVRAEHLRYTSLKRTISPDEVADMVLFLCSTAARNITGQSLNVDAHTWAC